MRYHKTKRQTQPKTKYTMQGTHKSNLQLVDPNPSHQALATPFMNFELPIDLGKHTSLFGQKEKLVLEWFFRTF